MCITALCFKLWPHLPTPLPPLPLWPVAHGRCPASHTLWEELILGSHRSVLGCQWSILSSLWFVPGALVDLFCSFKMTVSWGVFFRKRTEGRHANKLPEICQSLRGAVTWNLMGTHAVAAGLMPFWLWAVVLLGPRGIGWLGRDQLQDRLVGPWNGSRGCE